ncbi:thioredoxin-disulfide reductase [Candidatus Woesearchaeota archaeon]|nr:thioredoxin-disulfide reductase [Candidatus Woesearchaeota archaeon]
MEKVVIIGSGMAGLTAAIYTSRANLSPLVISGKDEGGQLMLTTIVENYPCFPEGISGPEMVTRAREQAKKFGTRFRDGNIESFSVKAGSGHNTYEIGVEGEKIEALSVIIATGASAKMLGIESELKYFNRGVHTCATCDGPLYGGKDVVVIGGGDSACEESMFLSKVASSVTIVHRRGEFRASKIMADRVFANQKIRVIWNSGVEEVLGENRRVTGVRIKDVVTGKTAELKASAVFLAIGHVPNSQPFRHLLDVDEVGYLKADSRMRTKLPGVFVAGDVYDRVYRQAITAAGTGCQAAIEAERYLDGIEH